MTLTIGKKDRRGNILVLGGTNADLFRTSSGTYSIDDITAETPSAAIEVYNGINKTSLALDHIEKYFEPWYQKNLANKKVFDVPSATTEGVSYTVTLDGLGDYKCTCPGWRFRNECWHVDAVKALSNG